MKNLKHAQRMLNHLSKNKNTTEILNINSFRLYGLSIAQIRGLMTFYQTHTGKDLNELRATPPETISQGK